MDTRKKPQLIIPRAQKIKTESRSEASHGGKAKGSSAMGSGQNTAQRISGDNHMRVKEVVDKVMISASEQVRLDVEKDQTLAQIVKEEKEARAVQIGQIGMAPTFIMGPRYKRKEAIESVVKKDMSATLVQNAKTMENKKRTCLDAAQKEKATCNLLSSKKQVQIITIPSDEEEEENEEEEVLVFSRKKQVQVIDIISSDDEEEEEEKEVKVKEEEEEEDNSSVKNYDPKGENMDLNSDDLQEYEQEEEDNSSVKNYDPKGENMDIDSDDSQEYEEEEEDLVTRLQQPTPLMVDGVVEEKSVEHEQQQEEEEDVEEKALVSEVAHERDDDDHTIVRVRNFEGCCMLTEVDRTNDQGVASRTRQCKALQRKNSQFHYNDNSKGTFSEPIDV